MTYESSPAMQERKRRRRERLLKAAVALFGRKGYHATTVPAIVRRARSSVGSFYFYFRNKEDVFGASLADVGEALGAALDRATASAAGPHARVRMLSESLMGWLTENPGEARILILESSGLSRGLERSRNAVLDSLAARFDAALQGAGVKGKDREAAARCFLGAALESGRHWLQASDQERESGRAAASRLARVQAARVG